MDVHVSVQRTAVLAAALGFLGVSVVARQATTTGDPEAAKIKNPVAVTPESLETGKKAYDLNCAGCHGNQAQGAEKANIIISVIEDQGGKQPPDLTDEQWDWGSTDGEFFMVTKKGVPPQFFMAPWDGRIPDADIWNIVNYVRSLAKKQ